MKKIIPLITLSVIVFASCSKKENSNKQSEKEGSSSVASSASSAFSKSGSSVQSLSPKSFVADRIFFKFDDASVQDAHKADLKVQAQYIKEKLAENNGLEVVIEGNCDERGGVEYNMVLGEKRANSVKDFLVSQGISAEKIKTASFGKERVLVSGTSAVAYLQNRTAITKIQDK